MFWSGINLFQIGMNSFHLELFQIRYTINWTKITVNGVDQFIFVAGGNVVGGLVNGVHQDGGQVDHHEDTQEVPVKM